MPHHTSLIAMLVAGFVLAFILGALANRLRLSPLVGYLAAGILAGPFTPGFVGDPEIAPQKKRCHSGTPLPSSFSWQWECSSILPS